MQWLSQPFEQLSVNQLYDILKLRCDVFIVEQTCYYPDLDDKDRDKGAIHLMAYEGEQLVAYARLLPPGCGYNNMSSLGRVVTSSSQRGKGTGHALLQRCLELVDQHWPDVTCHISAQEHLQQYYQQHGFTTVGEPYLEDDIPHIGMERPAKNA